MVCVELPIFMPSGWARQALRLPSKSEFLLSGCSTSSSSSQCNRFLRFLELLANWNHRVLLLGAEHEASGASIPGSSTFPAPFVGVRSLSSWSSVSIGWPPRTESSRVSGRLLSRRAASLHLLPPIMTSLGYRWNNNDMGRPHYSSFYEENRKFNVLLTPERLKCNWKPIGTEQTSLEGWLNKTVPSIILIDCYPSHWQRAPDSWKRFSSHIECLHAYVWAINK